MADSYLVRREKARDEFNRLRRERDAAAAMGDRAGAQRLHDRSSQMVKDLAKSRRS